MKKFKTAKEERIEKRQLEITKLKLEQDYLLGELHESIVINDDSEKRKHLDRLSEIHNEIESELKGIKEEKLKRY